MVEVVKGYAEHEKSLLTDLTQLRAKTYNNMSESEKIETNAVLGRQLAKIIAVAENYPDLKANTSFTELQEELRNTENKISYSRQFYNDSVTRYNIKVQTVPSNIIAGLFHFELEEFFKAESEEARQNVKVSF